LALVLWLAEGPGVRAAPVISNVTAAQRPSTDIFPKFVNISYTISDPDATSVNVTVLVSQDSGATWAVPAHTFPAAYGSEVGVNVPVTATPTTKTFSWDAGTDWDGHFSTHCRVRVIVNDSDLVLIPAGSYLRGNPPALGDTDIVNAPQFSVFVSAFFIDRNLVSGGKWNLVKEGYADLHGYTFVHAGSFKASSHPVHTVNWYDAVKWCNARSEREGLTPVYYTDAAFGNVYRTGEVAPFMKLGVNGYRLPTEAEWEKAARGGAVGHRYPWSDVDTISEDRANYLDAGGNFNPVAVSIGGGFPWTTPVGSFPPNAYGLSDMAGSLFEWCWDWYTADYYAPGQTDPQGPGLGTFNSRVMRGGSWSVHADQARCANRNDDLPNNVYDYSINGFRCVRGL
jgi:formylglycine-generating enzyme required for sulfatase activity